MRAHAYGLLRTILGTAASDGRITVNPCVIRGASSARRVHKIRPATLSQLEKLTAAMPDQYQLMILLASWCAMRFGELTELRRKDIDLTTETIRVERAVVRAGGRFQVTTPKSDAGIRDISIPPHLLPVTETHLAEHVGAEQDSLLFPATHGGIWPRRRCTGSSTRRVTPPVAPICGSTIFVTAGGARSGDRGDLGRTDGPSRASHPGRSHALSAYRRWS